MAVALSRYRSEWPEEFDRLAMRLGAVLGGLALRIDHIGSTAIPGMSAKDVIDAQVVVAALDAEQPLIDAFATAGFSARGGPWNRRDHLPAAWSGDEAVWDKMVFGPPKTERASNVHVRVAGSPNERYALLFRDFLRADVRAAVTWGAFKARWASSAVDVSEYGYLKDPATDLLMLAADEWAAKTAWAPPIHR